MDNDGSIRDKEGKIHLTPEQWVESIFGNNIPISSQYARDRVRHLFYTSLLKFIHKALQDNIKTKHPQMCSKIHTALNGESLPEMFFLYTGAVQRKAFVSLFVQLGV